jgi:predicted PurR-regulated permease PerM
MVVLLVLTCVFRLGLFVLTILFGYFALQLLSFGRHKKLGLLIYIMAVAAIGTGLVYFSRQAYIALPKIADSAIPAVVGFAEKNQIELPFSDYESLRTVALDAAKEGFASIGRYARAASFQFVLLIIGLVVAASLFLSPPWGEEDNPQQENLYSTVVRELVSRFKTFFQSFTKVIGAQLIISAVNTILTAAFLLWNAYPFATVLIVLVFLFGILPIVGNLISNTLIVGVGFTISPRTALMALIFLVVIHKLEYFLNSKIIGARIKSPMWLTLIGLVLGERLMGIPGMVLAPVLLHYIKVETSKNKAPIATPALEKPTVQASV